MKKILFAAVTALFLSVPVTVFSQNSSGSTLTVQGCPQSIDGNTATRVLNEVASETGINDADLQTSYDKGETLIEEIEGGYRVYISADNGGGIVDIMESNF